MLEGKQTLVLKNSMFNTEYSASTAWDVNIHTTANAIYGLLRSGGYSHYSIALILDCEETYELREELELKGEL